MLTLEVCAPDSLTRRLMPVVSLRNALLICLYLGSPEFLDCTLFLKVTVVGIKVQAGRS